MSKLHRIQELEAALWKIIHHCNVGATHAAIASVAEKVLKVKIPPR